MTFEVQIRDERDLDHSSIRKVVAVAFTSAPHANGKESQIVDRLRRNGSLTVSLVACVDENVVAYCALSPVRVGGQDVNWFGLGPVAVAPPFQRAGIGVRLIEQCLDRLVRRGANGFVVLGDPAFYSRFGFASREGLRFRDVPPEFLLALRLHGEWPAGEVTYDSAFG